MSKARLFLTLKTFLSKKIKRAHSLMSVLIPFRHTPFPLKSSANNFFDIIQDGKRGHTSARGGIYWEEQTYSDNRVLISIPPHFNPEQSPLIVVYLHGNQSSLARDVINRQHIPQQLADSKLNAILVAPQFAVNALDSSSGNFATQDFFAHFINELIEQICKWRTYASHKTT